MRAVLAKWLDWPQAWAAAALFAVWLTSFVPVMPGFGGYGPGLGLACLMIGFWLIAKAVLRMRNLATTVNPRGQPSALVTEGVFGLSRNPIYLGDVFILLAACFWWNSALGLGIVAGFVWTVNDRFISVEEDRLAADFGDQAAEWFNRVRRWI